MRISKLKTALAAAAISLMAFPAVAGAHVFVTPTDAPAGGFATLVFTIPHGCDGAATNQVSIKMPPEIVSATPQAVPGWEVKTKEGKLAKPVEQEGETITEGVREVTWSGGPLPDGQFTDFGISVSFAGEAGDVAEFPTIQGCEGGKQVAWIQPTPASGDEPEHPIPAVMLGEPEEEGQHSMGSDESAEAANHDEASASSDSDSDDGGDGLAIAALIVGALGLIAGGAALVTVRRSA